jgi:hypothetical protein
MKIYNYLKNEKYTKTIVGILVFLIIMIVAGMFAVKAEDNKTRTGEWTTQLLYDTVNACYQGTYKWILMANPALIGSQPPPRTQRQMVQHCFCVLDKLRNKFYVEEYIEFVESELPIGQLFMKSAYECMEEFDTMRGIIILQDSLDNGTKTDNGTIEKLEVLPAEPEGPEESSPDEKPKDQQTILQG